MTIFPLIFDIYPILALRLLYYLYSGWSSTKHLSHPIPFCREAPGFVQLLEACRFCDSALMVLRYVAIISVRPEATVCVCTWSSYGIYNIEVI